MSGTLTPKRQSRQLKVDEICTLSVSKVCKLKVEMPDKTVGQLIQEGLERKSWSASELARQLDVSPTHINNLKNDKAPSAKSGKSRYNPDLIDRIARKLEIPRSVLRNAAGLATQEEQEKFDPQKESYISVYDELAPVFKRLAMKMAETLLREQRILKIGTSQSGERKSKHPEVIRVEKIQGGRKAQPSRKRRSR